MTEKGIDLNKIDWVEIINNADTDKVVAILKGLGVDDLFIEWMAKELLRRLDVYIANAGCKWVGK